jgi:4-phytase/acid phosphatase
MSTYTYRGVARPTIALLVLFCGVSASPAFGAGHHGLRLDRIVMLMRHGVRSPTGAEPVPAEYSDQPWPRWPVRPGELTSRGAEGAALLGAADRAYLVRLGVVPGEGCPTPGAVTISASSAQRAISTGEAWVHALLPGCEVPLGHPSSEMEDSLFHALAKASDRFNGHKAWQDAMAFTPAEGFGAELRAHASDIALLEHVLGCAKPRCDLTRMPVMLHEEPHGRPNLTGVFDVGTTASQTFLLEYLEGMPMTQVGWGRIDRRQIEQLLRFHLIEFRYSNQPVSVALAAASPLAERIVHDLTTAGQPLRVAMLVGHDTNIADLGSLLALHWHIASYPEGDTPPDGAMGFELWTDGRGGRYVRAFYRALSMDQLRFLRHDKPIRQYLTIPGCGNARLIRSCMLSTFVQLVDQRVARGPEPAP